MGKILNRKFFKFVAAITFFWFANNSMAQVLPGEGTDSGLGGANIIAGTVLTPSGQRFDGRRVQVKLRTMMKGDRSLMTDEKGNFVFRNVPNGNYSLVIEKELEFEPYTQNIDVFVMRGSPPATYTYNIQLKPKAGIDSKPAVINSQFAGVPADAMEHYKTGTELAKKGNHKEAIAKLQLAIEAHPKFGAAYNDMGVQYLRLKDLSNADEAFLSAIKIDKDAFAPALNHGMVLFELKQFEGAEPVLREVVKLKQESAVAHFFLGQTLANLGKFDEAQKELTESLSLGGEPMAASFKEAHRLLAIIYSIRGDRKRQAAELEAYLKLAPDAPDAEKIRELIRQLRA
jgi:Flp pilus assembly protein TadD